MIGKNKLNIMWLMALIIVQSRVSAQQSSYQYQYSGTPPYEDLVNTTTFFGPDQTPSHFLIRKPR